MGLQCLLAFSAYTNVRKWMNTSSPPDDISCLHGIRVISMSWIVLAHTWYMITFIPVWNMVDLKKVDGLL